MILFNLFALGQALIVIAIVAILHWIINFIGIDLDLIGGTFELPFSLMLGSFICAFTELRGIKGRLFWIPIWILLLISSLIIAYSNTVSGYFTFMNKPNDGFQITDYYILLYIVAGVIIVCFYKHLNKFMMKKWEVSKEALNELKSLKYKELEKKEFWNFISHSYFKPSPIFYNFPAIWFKIYKTTIKEEEYIYHTVEILRILNEVEVEQKLHKKWINNFYHSVKEANKLSEFNPPLMGFKRLEECIRQNY